MIWERATSFSSFAPCLAQHRHLLPPSSRFLLYNNAADSMEASCRAHASGLIHASGFRVQGFMRQSSCVSAHSCVSPHASRLVSCSCLAHASGLVSYSCVSARVLLMRQCSRLSLASATTGNAVARQISLNDYIKISDTNKL